MRIAPVTFPLIFCLCSLSIAETDLTELKAKAEAGDVEAQYQLGRSFLKAYNYTKDDYKEIAKSNFEAEMWFHRAAEQGHARAQYELGQLYDPDIGHLYGFTEEVWRARRRARVGVDPDSLEQAKGDYGVPYEIQSEKWYLKAAKQGLAEAQTSLAWLYMRGFGRADSKEAINWLEKAAKQNHAPAQYDLGLTYSTPNAAVWNYPRAYFWLEIAIENNYEYAHSLHERVRKQLTEEQMKEAQKLITE